MRERWFFLLLCPLLIQLNGSYSFEDDNEDGLNRTSSGLIAEKFVYEGEYLNGSDSKSGMAKIRRVRSTKEEYEKAKNDTRDAENEKIKAVKEQAIAANESTTAEDELDAVVEEIRVLQLEIDEAEKTEKTATNASKTADGEYARILAEYRIAAPVHEEAEKEWKRLDDLRKGKQATYTETKSKLGTAKSAESGPSDNVDDEKEKVDAAERELVSLKLGLPSSNDALENARTKQNENQAAIDNAKSNKDLSGRIESANNNEKSLNGDLVAARNKEISLKKWQKMLNDNTILKKKIVETDWTGKSVGKIFQDWLTKKEKLNAQYEIKKIFLEEIKEKAGSEDAQGVKDLKAINEQISTINSQMIFLEQLNQYYTDDILENLVKKYDSLKTDVSSKQNTEIQKMAETLTNLEKEENILTKASSELEELRKKMGKKYKSVETDGVTAVKNKPEIDRVFNEKFEADKKLKGKIKSIEKDILKFKAQFRVAKIVLEELEEVTETAKAKEIVARTVKEEAEEVTDSFYMNVVKPLLTKKSDKSDAIETNKLKAAEALTLKKAATDDVKAKEEEMEKKKTTKIEKERNVATTKEILREKNNKYVSADSAVTTAANKEKVLEKQYNDEEKAEKEKKDLLKMLQLGLGITVAIIVVLVGGVIATFLIIRRKKKKAIPEKKPYRYEFKTEEGLTCIRREGEMDQHVIKGEDFKIMGPLVRGRVHNTPLPDKHMLDDQVGGDKIDKITFPAEMNEAYFVGEGIEIMHPDSVSLSEGRHLLDGVDMSPSRKDKPKKEKEKEKDVKSNEKDSKGNPPSSSEDKKSSDEKKPDEKKSSSSKSKRSNDPNAKNVATNPIDGEKKTDQQQKK